MKKKRKSAKGDLWTIAKKKYRLKESHIYMAKALGLNPKKFGSYTNHKQQPWKAPLPDYIEELYEKRFKKEVSAEIRAMDKKKEKLKPIKNPKEDIFDFEDSNENDLPF